MSARLPSLKHPAPIRRMVEGSSIRVNRRPEKRPSSSSVTRLGLIQRFKGGEGAEPALDRLGGASWSSGKEKVRKAIEKIAADLVEMYAYRKVAKGFRYDPPGELYHEFEATFGFEETPDQARAIEDVLADMDKSEPMPRQPCRRA